MAATAVSIVQAAEDAYNALDIDRILELFTPDVVFHENGKLVGKGIEDVRRWHEKFLAAVRDFRISKTLRVASGNLLGVEYGTTFTNPRTGQQMQSFGGEFWTMDGDRLAEWHLYWRAYPAEAVGA
jgi:nuclear transport factor 2 (NTF2) superfamily protein